MDRDESGEARASHAVTRFRITRRRLPHWEEPGATYFVTFRLDDSATVDLSRSDIAPVIIGAIRHFNGVRYRLYDYTVMPDHVHMVIQPEVLGDASEPLYRIMHSIKSWSATQINQRLGRRGRLWRDESYDHIVRNETDYHEKARYIWENPARQGLAPDPADWAWWGHGQAVEE